MWNLLKSELLKLRRCQILLVGLVALALCPLVQYGSQLIVEAEYRNPNYDFSALFENVIWGNTQIFLPISLVMIGGCVFSWRYADRVSGSDDLFGLYAADPDFWADPRGISGRFHSGVLPWIQHVVFQKWYPCQHLSVLCCADFSGI